MVSKRVLRRSLELVWSREHVSALWAEVSYKQQQQQLQHIVHEKLTKTIIILFLELLATKSST